MLHRYPSTLRLKPLACGFVALLSIQQSTSAITTAPIWHPREIVASSMGDTTSHEGADRALAFDHHGNPGIAFFDELSDDLRFAQRVPGIGWASTPIDTVGNVGKYPSLAFDRHERPAISYFDDTNDDLKYARFSGTAWIVETVAPADAGGFYTSLAFDRLGRAAVAYRDLVTSSLKFVRDNDGDGSLQDETPVPVTSGGNQGVHASLVFDSLNRAMIAHQKNVGFDLQFSVEQPALGWLTTTVDNTVDASFPSIDIDPDTGYPAIAYFDGTNFDLRYAQWDGTSWTTSLVDGANNTGWWPSLAFDPADGNPAISYHYSTFTSLKIAWHDGVNWQNQTVDASADLGKMSSLAFNPFGNGLPSIAYFEEAGALDHLYFIEDPLPVPEPQSLALSLTLIFWFFHRRPFRTLC